MLLPRWLRGSGGVRRSPLKSIGFVLILGLSAFYILSRAGSGDGAEYIINVRENIRDFNTEIPAPLVDQSNSKSGQIWDDATAQVVNVTSLKDKLIKSLLEKAENQDLIFYNRVPKCASTGIRLIMKALASTNKFNLDISQIFNKEVLNSTEQSSLIDYLQKEADEEPTVYVRHIHHIDFKKYGQRKPIYINVVREPFERLVSDYYFKRFHLGYMYPMKHEDKHRSYDECVLLGLKECIDPSPKGFYRIIPYFCGQDPECLKPSQWALDRAKETVERYYSVIGIAEDVPGFMAAIESVFPRYFKGALRLFTESSEHLKKKLKTRGKIPPNSTTISIMKEKLSYDYEFYYFIKEKFDNLKLTLGV